MLTYLYTIAATAIYMILQMALLVTATARVIRMSGPEAKASLVRWKPYVIPILVLDFLSIAFFVPAALTGEKAAALLLVASQLPAMLGILVAASTLSAFPDVAEPSFPESHPARTELVVLCVGMLIWSFGVLGIASHFDLVKVKPNGIIDQMSVWKMPFTFTAFAFYVLLGAILEEIVFRGGFRGWLMERRVPTWLCIVLPSIIWAFGHAGYIEQPGIKELQIFGMGILLGIARERHGLNAAIMMHLVNNGLTLILALFVPE